jgi:hypothetical protein
MAVVDEAGAIGFGVWIESEDHRDGLPPVGAVGSSVEYAHIDLHMRPVIVSQFRASGRSV